LRERAAAASLNNVRAMGANGSRKPPRPRIEMLGGNPTDEEAAAIVAALEQFLAETAPAPQPAPESRWLRAALWEGVHRDPRSAGIGARAGGWG
jgi:hypothetical protein